MGVRFSLPAQRNQECHHISDSVLFLMYIKKDPHIDLKSTCGVNYLGSFFLRCFQHAGQPLPLTRSDPVACHSCLQSGFEQIHQSFLFVPATTRSAGLGFFEEYSRARWGWVTARLFFSVTALLEHPGQPLPLTRLTPLVSHSWCHSNQSSSYQLKRSDDLFDRTTLIWIWMYHIVPLLLLSILLLNIKIV